ncbi:hypothetical protein AAVH_22232 [Aphelenchoides avenae]|nr:hypothetical protein AAVH_41307 [Aphelenchus avenae]KAH7710494.1 hypothetical protein AAVH_22232 [Aphelenchus avenae]
MSSYSLSKSRDPAVPYTADEQRQTVPHNPRSTFREDRETKETRTVESFGALTQDYSPHGNASYARSASTLK